MDEDARLRLFYTATFANPIVEAQSSEQTVRSPETPIDIPFKEIFALGGAALTGGAYMLTYPIVYLDGPLPIVDSLWLAGLALAMQRGFRMGSRIGRGLDVIEELLL